MKAYDLENHFYAKPVLEYLDGRSDYPLMTPEKNILYRQTAMLPSSRPSMNNPAIKTIDELEDLGDIRLGYMDQAGVGTAVVSSGGLIEELGREDAVRLARATNDAAAEACRRHPGRIMGAITLPAPYIDESIAELERAVNELGLKYWHTHSNFGDECLCDEKFEPLLAKCAQMDIPFYLHPSIPSNPYLLDSGVAMSMAAFGFTVDTMKTALRLIIGGVFDRYPNLKMIMGHMGEIFPYCLDRMDNRFGAFRAAGVDPFLKSAHPLKYYFEHDNIFVTTSGIYDPKVVEFAAAEIGIDHIMFGTDYPFENFIAAVDFVRNLPLSDEDKDKIFFGNAEKYILKV